MLSPRPNLAVLCFGIGFILSFVLALGGSLAQQARGVEDIEIGMSADEVEHLIGKPEYVGWSYEWNDLTVVFKYGEDEATGVTMQLSDGGPADLPVRSGMTSLEIESLLGKPPRTYFNYDLGDDRRGIVEFNAALRVKAKSINVVKPPAKIFH